MNDKLNFIIRGLSQRREDLKVERLKMETFMGLRKFEHFRWSYREVTKIVCWLQRLINKSYYKINHWLKGHHILGLHDPYFSGLKVKHHIA